MSLLGKSVILPIQSEDIGHYAETAIPFIQKALEQTSGELTLSGILDDIANRKRQLWLIKADGEFIAGVVTQMFTTPTGIKIGEITVAGGRAYESWNHFSDVVGAWFKEQGCNICRVIGREGWVKLLKEKGFRHAYTTVDKEL